jgi:hypothetical protein
MGVLIQPHLISTRRCDDFASDVFKAQAIAAVPDGYLFGAS